MKVKVKIVFNVFGFNLLIFLLLSLSLLLDMTEFFEEFLWERYVMSQYITKFI